MTHEEFVERLYNLNDNIIVKSEYKNSKDRVYCQCKICGNEWWALASNLSKGRGCRKCADKRRTKTHEQFVEEMRTRNPRIQIIGKYINAKEKILCKCMDCKNEFESAPTHLLAGKGCPFCKGNKISKALAMSREDYVDRLHTLFPYIDLLSEFKNFKTKIYVKCQKCGHKWHTSPGSLLVGCGCPDCSVHLLSTGEVIIRDYLDKLSMDYDMHKTFDDLRNQDGYKLSYDFYLPALNILIEFQGRQHYMPVEIFGGDEQLIKQLEHDRIKQEYANKYDIKLLIINYKDKNNIEQILNETLLTKLSL